MNPGPWRAGSEDTVPDKMTMIVDVFVVTYYGLKGWERGEGG